MIKKHRAPPPPLFLLILTTSAPLVTRAEAAMSRKLLQGFQGFTAFDFFAHQVLSLLILILIVMNPHCDERLWLKLWWCTLWAESGQNVLKMGAAYCFPLHMGFGIGLEKSVLTDL